MRAVFAKSFARIHRRNLISQGIPPLTFLADTDYDRASQGECWELPDLQEELRAGSDQLMVEVKGSNRSFTVQADFSERERNVLLAGGLLAYVRSEHHDRDRQ